MLSSKVSRVLFLVIKRRPGRRESPVTRERDRKAGRSAYMEQLGSGGCSGVTEINQLQKLQNRAARIVTGSSFDTLCQPLSKELGWKTIDQLINSETNIIVYKSLHELAPQYICNQFTRASQLTSRCLRNTLTDLRLPKKNSKTGQKCFSEVLRLGMPSLLRES